MPDEAEWIVDERERNCPSCGAGPYRALGQHWRRSASCSPPALSDELEHVVRGLLLGDASLEGSTTPLLAITSTREAHIRWVHDQLDWLSRGITHESDDSYRVRSVAVPELGRYLTWTGREGVPTTGWELTSTSARAWYACDGSLEYPARATTGQITWSVDDDRRRRALTRLLRRAGYSPTEWERRVALPRSETTAWAEWTSPAPPGSEHKWP